MENTPMGTWRAKSIEEFGLLPLPDEWSVNGALAALSQSDDATWKRYYEFRKQHNPGDREAGEKGDEEEDEEYSEEGSENEDERGLKEALLEEVSEIAKESPVNAAGAAMWLQHAQVALKDTVYEDVDCMRSATYYGLVFSPYALPRAVELNHNYHNRARWASREYFMTWTFKLLRFDGEPGGDATQLELARKFRGGYPSEGLPPETVQFNTKTGHEELCSDELEDPPMIEPGVDAECYIQVHKTATAGLTPMTVRRIRGWLFGHVIHSVAVLDDFAMMRLLFATCGTAEFSTGGHSWPDRKHRESAVAELHENGVEPPGQYFSINWLEHQVRVACGALRPIDKFYEPQDTMREWEDWGKRVLKVITEDQDRDREDEKFNRDLAELSRAPILVYLRAKERQLGFDGHGGVGGGMDIGGMDIGGVEAMFMQRLMTRIQEANHGEWGRSVEGDI